MKKAYLVLKNGRVFEGQAIGAEGIALGEMVFTTGVTGYIENLTDPCYVGQIVMQTFPLVGNYGVAHEDIKGQCCCAGFVVRELCEEPSNFRSEDSLDAFLKEQGVVGICGVDTREITGILRDEGVMTAMICGDPALAAESLQSFVPTADCQWHCASEKLIMEPAGEKKFRIAVIDCGAGRRLAEALCRFGCVAELLPTDTGSAELMGGEFDGVAVSEGPGDPAQYAKCTEALRHIAGSIPVLGVGLGFQLAALAIGGCTYKLKYGHRGSNQPVKHASDGRVYITTQNHGYAVIPPQGIESAFMNINDGSCEGFICEDRKLMGVQFMPQISKDPNDMSFVFAKFMDMMGGYSDAER